MSFWKENIQRLKRLYTGHKNSNLANSGENLDKDKQWECYIDFLEDCKLT